MGDVSVKGTTFQRQDILLLAFIALVLFILSYHGWIGYRGYHDDNFVIRAARGWQETFPYLGDTHWELRHTLVLPVALSFWLFGENDLSFILPVLIANAGCILITYFAVLNTVGRVAAVLCCLLLATFPVLTLTSTTAYPDVIEAFFVVVAFWLLFFHLNDDSRKSLLLIVGVAAALAFMTRESAAAVVFFVGLLFLAGYGTSRMSYFIIGAGFVAVIGMEWFYYFVQDGNPLYRVAVSLHHGKYNMADVFNEQSIAAIKQLQTESPVLRPGRGYEPVGLIHLHWLIDPYLSFFSNHEYGLVFFLATPAWIWLCLSKAVSPATRRMARLLGLLAICWLIVSIYVLALRPHPRYFLVVAYGAAVTLGLWFAHLIAQRHTYLAAVAIAGVLMVNVLAIDLQSERLLGERLLAEQARTQGEAIYADGLSARNASFFLSKDGLADRVVAKRPAPGALYFYHPDNVASIRKTDIRERFLPKASWERLWQYEPRKRLAGYVIDLLGLKTFLPPYIYKKISNPDPRFALYRIG